MKAEVFLRRPPFFYLWLSSHRPRAGFAALGQVVGDVRILRTPAIEQIKGAR